VGYVTGAASLLLPMAKAHQYLTFSTAPNLQRAVAYGLSKDAAYFRELAGDLQRKRDFFSDGLKKLGFGVLESQGTYFVNADFKAFAFNGNDADFCRHLTTQAGVTPIPVSAFYEGPGPDTIIRFAFCKEDATLTEALSRLARHFGKAV
jgi:aspartate/methionine/tyrosine aminotransferase